MNESTWKSIWFWRLAIFKITGKACMALLLSVVGTLNGVEWSSFLGTQKFVAIVVALGAMWTVVDAFLNETMSELKAKRERETQFIEKPK